MREINIGKAAAFADPGRRLIEIDGAEFAVFKLAGEFIAFENVCTHMGGPACQGKMLPRSEERVSADGQGLGLDFSETEYNVVCPWHGFEYDIRTGAHVGYSRFRLRSTPVRIVDGDVLVTIPERIPTTALTQFQIGGA